MRNQTDEAKRTVFVSYSRDDRERVLPVIHALEASGVGVWWDGLLVGGDRFAKTTETALETADAVVVVWSRRSVESHWVRDEATRGRDRGCMISLALDGVEPPLGFRQIQYIDMGKWHGKADSAPFRELLAAIENASCSPDSGLNYAGARTKAKGVSRRSALLLGGAGVVLAGGALVAWRSGMFGGGAASNSIAVLAFKNLSGDASQDYFSDGLSEELRATLSMNPALTVAAQASSALARADDASMEDIARRLDVAFILDGSVRRAGDQLRVIARLIDGKTGYERWSETFDRTMADVLAVQEDISTNVVDALLANFALQDGKGIHRLGGTSNDKALDAYLRGRSRYDHAANEESDRAALAAFNEAIRLDPGYAAAHAAASRAATAVGSSYASGGEVAAFYETAMAEARRAVELAPDLAEGHSALGFVLMNGKLDLAAAREPYERSFELGYGNAPILTMYAGYANNVKQADKAREAIARAIRLDPLNPLVFRMSAVIEFTAGDDDAAAKAARTALTLDPEASIVHRILGDIALKGGDLQAARAEYMEEPSEMSRLVSLAVVDSRLSGEAAGQAHFDELLSRFGNNGLYQQAEVLAQWGRKDAALDALEQGLAAGDSGLVLAPTDPLLDPIRHEPRFAAILERLDYE
ncbi:TIR domain-containing protein [Altererythrobacter salegens]|uniref:TIR domain-containing protein n=1 Tax=Croceibacterium salegens TaxID=1737568 RepID=A0A6I4T0E4_9SPHN|nr:TIR domain-containing protein [Croceibacterium salegens]MXO60890.1 TIR domain-containing protein [Croceibacterium salegens]